MLNKKVLNVFDAYFYLDGKIALVQENLTNSSISSTVQNSLIKNGRGNKTWASIDYDKELNVELQTNVIDFNQIALSAGSAIVEGATTVYTEAKVHTISGTKITLAKEPLVSSEVQIIEVATDKVLKETTDYTISGTDVTFTSITGDVKVLPYTYTSVAGAKEIKIAADKFASTGKLVLKSVMIDEGQKATDYVEIVIEKAKPASDFTISSSSEVSNGNDNTMTLTALADDKGNLGYIHLIPIED
nr:MAG TPA: structural protein [Caudoviricetes sp.]